MGLRAHFRNHVLAKAYKMADEIPAANWLVAYEKPSHDVHTNQHPPEGKSADGSAESIAECAERSHKGNIGKAIRPI